MSYVFLSIALVIVALVLLYLHNHYSYWARRGIPQEDPIYGLGNMKGIGREFHFRDINSRLYERFKRSASPLGGIYMFFMRSAFIVDLDIIKHILIKDFSSFHDRGIFSNVRDEPLTGHLLRLEGEQWRAMRNKLTPVFTSGKMKFMFPTVVAVAENLSRACGEFRTEFEVRELTARYTTDVIGTCAFGIECNSLSDPNAEFRNYGRLIFGKPRHSQLVQALILFNPELARKLRCKVFNDEVTEFFINAVRSTVEYRVQNKVKRNDFMDMLIEMMAEDQEAAAQHDSIDLSQGLTLLQMAAQAFVFFIAGFHTSSTTMSFCLYELAMNQDIQDKLREEILRVLSAHNNIVTYEAVNEMTYLEQVLSETLRKYTVLPHLLRTASSDYRIPNTSLTLPKGSKILIPVDAIHHDPEIFPEPDIFDPARFDPDIAEKRHACAYMPFGDGPRNCIGLRFGKMQAKVGLIHLLRDYKFIPSTRTENPIVLSKRNFVIEAENGIYLKAVRVR
ncbi:probable cytochrome P450 6a14 [Ceratitis capitata]|uniref:probable cytochrome P450 6a14 n=1 Tax=Ceratitis capitata TaxID=7213 RepID=UPI000C6C86FC|nr:probable cytochrome P450 6a14 [Ceratitis capitata]